jgi:thiamine-monophosphate kinase
VSPSRTPLGPGAEFDLIRTLMGSDEPLPPGVEVGPGDDALVLEGGWVISVDLTVEEIHYRREWVDAEEVGYRATAAALSDLAAMAAGPVGVLLSLALSKEEIREQAPVLQRGAARACRREGVAVLGGDVTTTPGPSVIDVVAMGRTSSPVGRAGSRPGDEVWVTGRLGASAGAVLLWERGEEPPEALRKAFVLPEPRIREARWLAERVSLHGLIDLSDGLAGDAGHLAAAGRVGIVLLEEAVPVHAGVMGVVSGSEQALGLALTGGEDYEICFTVGPGGLDEHVDGFRKTFGLSLTRVGRVEEGEGIVLEDPTGRRRPLPSGGFSHVQHEEDG